MAAITVPLGQYIPGDTAVHRLDARAKIVTLVAVSVALFASNSWWALGVCAVCVAVTFTIAHLPLRLVLRGIKPVIFLLILTVLLNAVGRVGADAFFDIAGYGIKPDGLLRGLYFATRIVVLIVTTSLLTYTTSPVELTDALVSLMRPLARVRVPVEDIAMMFSIALRFIPTTAEEAEKIVTAQTARGARFNDKNLMQRLKAWIPVLIPLFVNLFRRADSLAIAMESRCYRGEGRTHVREYKLTTLDIAIMISSIALAVILSIWL